MKGGYAFGIYKWTLVKPHGPELSVEHRLGRVLWSDDD